MMLSTKSTYGLRAMLDIASDGKKSAVATLGISKKEGISQDYLEQLLNRLRHSGLVVSVRGAKGGYRLARPAAEITVADVVTALEGDLAPTHCTSAAKTGSKACKRSKDCVPKVVWARLASAINECLDSMTLEDLCGAGAGARIRRRP